MYISQIQDSFSFVFNSSCFLKKIIFSLEREKITLVYVCDFHHTPTENVFYSQ